MAFEFLKQRQAVDEAVENVPTMEERVDRYVEARQELDAQKKALKKLQEKVKELELPLLEEVEETVAADESLVLSGRSTKIKFGIKTLVVKDIDLERVELAVGTEAFLKMITVPVGKVRAYLNPEEQAEALTEERSGSRSIKII